MILSVLYSRRASRVPGDTLRELTRAAYDVHGREWPRGTKYQPSSHGYDALLGATVTVVRIAGERVEFAS